MMDHKSLGAISRRIRLLAARAVIRLINDAAKEQTVQMSLLAGEVGEGERYQHYGFTSVPLAGAEAIVLCIGGARDHLVTVADGDRRHRPTGWDPGEAGIYDHQGQIIRLMADGTIRIYGTAKVRIEADLEVVGNITATGNVSDANGSMQEMRGVYNPHNHGTGPAPNQQMG